MELIDLICNKSYDEVKVLLEGEPYNCIVKEDCDYYIVSYNMIASDFSNPVVKQCRGIILTKGTNQIVCRAFDKFFNYGESHADTIDWNTAKVTEKVDGSLVKLWMHNGLHISTNGMIDAFKTNVGDTGKTFGELIVEAFEKNNFELASLQDGYTHIFEVVSPWNRVVVPYAETDVYYLGSRNNETFEECIFDLNLKKPKLHPMKTLEEVVAVANNLPFSEEGYVVVDAQYHRVKIKSPAYLAVHRLKGNDGFCASSLLKLAQLHDGNEVVVYFPEIKEKYEYIEKMLDELIWQVKDDAKVMFDEPFTDRKGFAMRAQYCRLPDIMFKLLDKKLTADDIKEYICNMDTKKLIDILKLK